GGDPSCACVAAGAQEAARAEGDSSAGQTKCPARLLKRGWAPQKRGGLAGATRWQASIRHDDRRSRARWNVDGDHKSSIWFSTTDGARELVCADVALSGNHCELRKTPVEPPIAAARMGCDLPPPAAPRTISSSPPRRTPLPASGVAETSAGLRLLQPRAPSRVPMPVRLAAASDGRGLTTRDFVFWPRNGHKLLARTSSALASTPGGMVRLFRATSRPHKSRLLARKFLVYSN